MALLDRFKKQTKKQIVREVKKKTEEKPEEKFAPQKTKEIADKNAVYAYRFLKDPHITEKATGLAGQDKYIFKVYPRANKIEIKKIIESLYGVKIVKVNMVHIASKKRKVGKTEGWKGGLKRGYKKAIVTLAKGEKIELMPK